MFARIRGHDWCSRWRSPEHVWGLVFASLVLVAVAASGCAGTVTEANTANARIHHDIGVSNLGRGELREALRELLIAADLDPDLPQTHNALGIVFHALDKSKEALAHYERAIELRPDFSEAHNNLGVLLIDLGRYSDAIVHFKKALGDILYATPALAEGNMGWAYYKNGDVEAGRMHLRNAVAQSPKFCRGYLWLARIGVDTGDAAEAIANARRFDKYCLADAGVSSTLAPEYAREMHYYLGIGYLKQGDREAARKSFSSCAVSDGGGEFGAKCTQSLRLVQ